MTTFDIDAIREQVKITNPSADFDGIYTFYYDETNNIRKFHVKETGFNSTFTNNFVLGGLAHEGPAPDVRPLIDSFKLQTSVEEVKLKHIAKGGFINCLGSKNLNLFLRYLINSDLYIHYSSINILYWSIVDIVDSAIAGSEINQQLCLQLANTMKNDLYKLAKMEIKFMVSLFQKYGYPNIKQGEVLSFIEEMSGIFIDYSDNMEFHTSIETLRQLLKEAGKKGSLPFIMGKDDFVLIDNFSHFYLRPIYMFKNSAHIFDNEDSIVKLLAKHKIMDEVQEINNYSFIDSKSNQLTQLSDILVGIIGKLTAYFNAHEKDKICSDICSLNLLQGKNIDLFLGLIDKSYSKNIGFLHDINSYEEILKIKIVRECRDISQT